ncbi:hypothetical protein BHM03_00060012, partial [Ensete ventricosum]
MCLLPLLHPFVHPSFHDVFETMPFGDKLSFLVMLWHKLPVFLGLTYLQQRRTLHEKYSLLNVGMPDSTRFNPDDYAYRTDDGEYNDPENSQAGSQNTFFGRNMPPMEQNNHICIPYENERMPFLLLNKIPKISLTLSRFYSTKEVPTGGEGIEAGHLNVRTSWWDGSVIYGSEGKKEAKVRTHVDGKLKIGDNDLLQHEVNGIAISGDIRNSWAGVSTLQ